jgi:hypothetical protein
MRYYQNQLGKDDINMKNSFALIAALGLSLFATEGSRAQTHEAKINTYGSSLQNVLEEGHGDETGRRFQGV